MRSLAALALVKDLAAGADSAAGDAVLEGEVFVVEPEVALAVHRARVPIQALTLKASIRAEAARAGHVARLAVFHGRISPEAAVAGTLRVREIPILVADCAVIGEVAVVAVVVADLAVSHQIVVPEPDVTFAECR